MEIFYPADGKNLPLSWETDAPLRETRAVSDDASTATSIGFSAATGIGRAGADRTQIEHGVSAMGSVGTASDARTAFSFFQVGNPDHEVERLTDSAATHEEYLHVHVIGVQFTAAHACYVQPDVSNSFGSEGQH